jgi:hypothetical protein
LPGNGKFEIVPKGSFDLPLFSQKEDFKESIEKFKVKIEVKN